MPMILNEAELAYLREFVRDASKDSLPDLGPPEVELTGMETLAHLTHRLLKAVETTAMHRIKIMPVNGADQPVMPPFTDVVRIPVQGDHIDLGRYTVAVRLVVLECCPVPDKYPEATVWVEVVNQLQMPEAGV